MLQSSDLRLHDLKSVYTDFAIVFQLIKGGYRFDDENGPLVLERLEKAIQTLKREIQAEPFMSTMSTLKKPENEEAEEVRRG